MGLLDELELEAERLRAEQARHATDREVREAYWNEHLLPAMRRLDDYLQRLTRTLAQLKKRARAVFPLPGYGDVVAFIEPNYIVQSTPTATAYEITMEGLAAVTGEGCPLIECDSLARVRSVTAVLHQHRLTGISDLRKNSNGEIMAAKFRAKGRIPLKLVIAADLDSGQVRMQFLNLEGLGQSNRVFRAEDIDDALMDSLGRFIAREQQHFGQQTLDDGMRRQLQSRVQRDQIKREWERKLSRQLAEDEAEVVASLDRSVRPGGLFARLFRRRAAK
jgi:hypothetical protein